MVSRVPIVVFSQWTDQGTNVKLIEDVLKTNLKVTVNNDEILEGDEIRRCLELVVGDGERGNEMRTTMKWKELTKDAANDDVSSICFVYPPKLEIVAFAS